MNVYKFTYLLTRDREIDIYSIDMFNANRQLKCMTNEYIKLMERIKIE